MVSGADTAGSPPRRLARYVPAAVGLVAAVRRRLVRTDGSATVELAVLGPLMIAILLTLMGAIRISDAQQSVQTSAAQAARAASLARTAETAYHDGHAAAETSLSDDDLRCTDTAITVDTSQFDAPAGEHGKVTTTVTCVVDLSDMSGMALLPGSLTVTRTSTSLVDPYRGRSAP